MLLNRRHYSISIIIFISLLTYLNTFSNSFHYDDYSYILNNIAFKEYINHPFSISQTLNSLSNRSIVLATLYLNHSLDGFNVFGFHIVNLIIHISTCLLIFLFVKEILFINQLSNIDQSPSSPLYKRGDFKINIPLIAALIFAVHPINTQAVTYIAGRSSMLATFFYIASFLFFIKGISQREANNPHPIKRQVAATKWSYRSEEQTEPCIRRCNNNNLTPPKNSSELSGRRSALHKSQYKKKTKLLQKKQELTARKKEKLLRGNSIKPPFFAFYLKKILFLILSLVFMIAGYGSKTIIITAPLLFVIFYLIFSYQNSFFQRSIFLKRFFSKKFVKYAIQFIILSSPFILIFLSKYLNLQKIRSADGLVSGLFHPIIGKISFLMAFTEGIISSSTYLLTEFKVIIFYYIKMIFFPFNQNVDPDFPVAHGITDPVVLFSIGIIILCLYAGIYFFQKNRLISFGIFWFFITLLPTSSFLPLLDTAIEHRLYLPLLGIVIIVSTFLNSFYCKNQIDTNKRLIKSFIFILFPIIFFSLLTVQRNFVWKDEISLWLDAGKKSPGIRRPFNNLGEAYEKSGDYQKAVDALKKAIAISPKYDYAHNNLGSVYGKLNQFDLAIKEYRHVLKVNEKFPTVHFNLGRAYEMKGMLHEAAQEYSLSIEQQFDFYQAYFNLANIYSRQGSYQKAITTYQEFLKYKPSNPAAYFQLGNIYIKKGNIDKAFNYFSRAVKQDSNFLPAKIAVGNIFMMKGNLNKAEEIFQQVLKLDSNNFTAYNNLGLIYLRHEKDQSKAVRYFKKSLKINPAQPDAKSIMEKIQKYSQ